MLYRVCPSGHTWREFSGTCPSCGKSVSRVIQLTTPPVEKFANAPNISVFKPYVEDGFNGNPIEITSFKQRDALCAEHNLTYDRYSHIKKKKPDCMSDISFNTWMDHMKESGTYDKAVEEGRKRKAAGVRGRLEKGSGVSGVETGSVEGT